MGMQEEMQWMVALFSLERSSLVVYDRSPCAISMRSFCISNSAFESRTWTHKSHAEGLRTEGEDMGKRILNSEGGDNWKC
jgi:hypothetical protein